MPATNQSDQPTHQDAYGACPYTNEPRESIKVKALSKTLSLVPETVKAEALREAEVKYLCWMLWSVTPAAFVGCPLEHWRWRIGSESAQRIAGLLGLMGR